MLRYRTSNAITWIIATVMLIMTMPAPSSAGPPFYTETIQQGGAVVSRLAVDSDGIPHTAFWDFGNQFLMYAKRVDGAWVTEVVEATAFVGTDVSLAVDAQGVPHIAFHNFTGSGIDELRYAVRTGGVWNVVNVDPSGNDVGRYNSIRIDSQGRPHVTYYNETQQILRYAVKTVGWAIETVDVFPGTGKYSDMVLDSSDRPHVIYYQEGTNITKYRQKIGAVWYQESVGASTADYMGIALDPAGNAIIQENKGGYMTISTRTTGAFDSIYADTPTDIDGAMAVGNDGRIHIFYQDIDNGANDLWYLELENGGYDVSPAVIDGIALDLGDKCDIVIDPYGNPLGVFQNVTTFGAMFIDSGVRLSTPLNDAVWPVGSLRTIKWRGAGLVNLLLSTNGGASYQTLALNLNGGGSPGGGQYTFTVPHQPSHFCMIKLVRTEPYSASLSGGLFTIEGSVDLLNFVVTLPDEGGASLTWSTNPGPEDLAGYRVERRRDQGAWSTIVAMTKQTSVRDADGRGGDQYRLFSVNGLGQEMLLGTESSDRTPAITPLDVFPNPFSAGNLTIDFATAGGLGGGAGHATVAIYDVGGRLVHTLADRSFAAGMQRVTWDGRTSRGEAIPSGVYFIRAVTGADTHTKKVLVVR